MKYRLAMFDFDGTLADSFPFFLRVFDRLAEDHGFEKIDPERVPALRHSSARQLMAQVGLPAWKLPRVARKFVTLMEKEVASIPLFGGVDDLLRHLDEAGVTLAVVSSNSDDNVRQVLGPANTKRIRQLECGMSIFGKPARIRKVLRKTGIPAREAIYIGDQVTDMEAARAASVALGAVSWGYGTIESLRKQSPDEEFDRVADIKRIS